jgi:hypothetical protein
MSIDDNSSKKRKIHKYNDEFHKLLFNILVLHLPTVIIESIIFDYVIRYKGERLYSFSLTFNDLGSDYKPTYITEYENDVYINEHQTNKIHIIPKLSIESSTVCEPAYTIKNKRDELDSDDNFIFGIAVNKNKIYVSCKDHKINIFDRKTHKFIKSIGKFGTRPGEFVKPRGIALSNDKIYIIDSGNYRIQIFNNEHLFVQEYPLKGYSKNIIVDDSNNIIIDDGGEGNINIYDENFTCLKKINCGYCPDSFAISDNELFILRTPYHCVDVFDIHTGNKLYTFGNRGDTLGKFAYPCAIIIKDDDIHVMDTYNSRIQLWKRYT